jgi:hypothetical protein
LLLYFKTRPCSLFFMKDSKPKFSKYKWVLQTGFYGFCLIFILGLIRFASTDEFKRGLNEVLNPSLGQNTSLDPESSDKVLLPTQLRWCPDNVQAVEFLNKDIVLRNLQQIQKICSVLSEPYNPSQVSGMQFNDLLNVITEDSTKRVLQRSTSDRSVFKFNSLVLKSSSLANEINSMVSP